MGRRATLRCALQARRKASPMLGESNQAVAPRSTPCSRLRIPLRYIAYPSRDGERRTVESTGSHDFW